VPPSINRARSLPGFETLSSIPVAGLVIVHGLAEYAARYREPAAVLAEGGISCFAYDQRGHGDGPGPQTHIRRFAQFVADLEAFTARVRARFPDLPLFLWGHSMGSVVATLAAARPNQPYIGVVTTSHSLEVFRRGPNPLSPVSRLMAWLAPRARMQLRLDGTRISGDEAVQRNYAEDPRIARTATLRLIVEFATACERCRAEAPRIRVPWLVVHGEADRIAPVSGSRTLFELLGSADKKLVTYPELRHEVHNERTDDRARFLALISEWILARVPGTARALGAPLRD
jgi:alpha-beta hydrolase superfamily lysophospholipase